MCATTFRILDLPPRGKRKCQPISICVTHVMNQALYRSRTIPCAGTQVYASCYRSEWLSKITEGGVRRRAELYDQQLDALRFLPHQARKELLVEAGKHSPAKLLPCSCMRLAPSRFRYNTKSYRDLAARLEATHRPGTPQGGESSTPTRPVFALASARNLFHYPQYSLFVRATTPFRTINRR